MKEFKEIVLTGNDLTLEELVAVARHNVKAVLSEETIKNIEDSRKIIDDIVENERVIYGVTTGFGEFSKVSISKEDCKTLQENLIRSHACGYGDPLTTDIVRAIMLTRVNALSKGYSGIRLMTVQTLLAMLNKGVHPIIPEKGSLGASGDLAPLAHMVLPMLGLGEAEYQGTVMTGKEAMEKAGIPTIQLDAKEGLALINGTQVLTSVGALATYDAIELLKVGDIAAALSLEALRGITDAFDERLHVIRNHHGQVVTARNMLKLVEGSTYTTRQAELRVQDAYSLRCVPQIHGASKDTIAYVKSKVEIELNSVTDNPIVTREGDVISGGNFHGEPMAQPFDFLGIGAAEIANVSERRLERLINPQLNDLPAFLTKHGGLNSGYMITQYAAAALVSENKILAHPASVDSIPSSANQEDLVSMGTIAARTARDIVSNAKRVLATELMAACQAIDFRADKGFKLGKGTQKAYDVIREATKFIEVDTEIQMYQELNKVTEVITSGKLLEAVESAVELEY
ncbi:histidine ammonia-lyase [Peptoanaerobacter stomatis]|uniref:Histidine ammonia-lyase n=1 Tax=Peptoanaerobacter stomatis TaxID=796937 RepID=J5WUP4_9FIRM|nr:histidine ammonia-lyase [Peptoanaerobacter stomatis]EJU24537.1 histidine ammonia-lyase [Peptoanaerobacter stomatis]NWO25932.1 histidine ammonia-lyase [Peptostreptococcaceae bacterium oral taxon 081]